MSQRLVALAVILAALAACKEKQEPVAELPPAVAPGERRDAEPIEPSAAGDEALPVVTRSFDPVLSAPGLPDRMPAEIGFQYRWNLAPAAGQADDQTRVTVKPALAGRLMWSRLDRLAFQPGGDGLAYGTTYQFTLEQVNTKQGIKKSEKKPWTFEVVTPPFEISRVEIEQANFSRKRVAMVMTFSGQPDERTIASRVGATIRGKANASVDLPLRVDRLSTHEVRLTATSSAIQANATIELTVAAGIRSAHHSQNTGRGLRREFSLSVPGYVSINNVQVGEGHDGYYIDVFCNDDQQAGRYYYQERCPVVAEDLGDVVEVSGIKALSFSKIRNGFRVHGDIEYGDRRLIIKSGLTSDKGSVLTRTYEQSLSIPRRSPKVRFVSQGRYLPRTALEKLPISHVNVEELTLQVRQIHAKNLPYWLTAESETADERISDLIGTHKFALTGELDRESTTWLNVRKVFPKTTDGAYELTLMTPSGQRDAARVLLTDLTLIAKRFGKEGRGLHVWVIDSQSLEPVPRAEVELITFSNVSVAKCQTDFVGTCKFDNAIDELSRKQPFAMMVKKDDDISFLEFADLEVPLGDESVQGKPYEITTAYQAAIYSDRGVYRPGETAHVVALLRDDKQRGASEVPLVAKVYDPRAKMVQQLRAETNAVGMADFDVNFQSFASTGRYNLQLEVAGKVIDSYGFNVEEFMPERMKVTVTTKKSDYLMTEAVEVGVNARYLFGSKASGERVELACSLHSSSFKPELNGQYTYGLWSQEPMPPMALGNVSGVLDEDGNLDIKCPQPTDVIAGRGPSKVVAQASVFEAGSGRTTVAQATTAVHPEEVYVGLHSGTKKTEVGKPVEVKGIVVDWPGKPSTAVKEVTVEVLRLQAEYNYEYEGGHHRWRQFLRKMREAKDVVPVAGGKFSYSFTPSGYSQGYLVRATFGAAQSDLHFESQGYYYWRPHTAGADATPRPERPASLPIEVPAQMVVGETTKVTFTPPFAGKMLFSVETDRIVHSRWLDVEMKATELEVKLDEFTPTVYVSGLLIKDPHRESKKAFMPGRAFGVEAIRVEPTRHMLSVEAKTPQEVRPNSKLEVELDIMSADGPIFATVAAVDEGVLQLTRFKSPDALAQLFSRRALGVRTFETIGWTLLLPPADGGKSPGGGEEEQADAAGRIAPVKPVALWSGVVEVEKGKAKVSFDVPQYRGELRVMVVAASPTRAGAVSKSVTVRDPLVLQATLPRFLLNGDRFVVPAFLTNLTGKKGTFTVSLKTGDGIELDGSTTKNIDLDVGGAGTVTFVGRSRESFGPAKFHVEARGNGTVSKDDVTIPFLPNAPVTRETHVVGLKDGSNDVKQTLTGWNPQTEQTSIWVTTNRYGKELGHLRYLIRYPYG